ncbi:protein MANNAN SYNTHESIS-RELATED 1-like isoform X1 [Actinidia eriantha]|uniref:protein MANNAN SYNTHESIS-RELATED 1-like isoform X1 n=1 Tax=Actinidia eriantha TaxID=165200 RepID=UPI00258A18F5|nr:protein MANNAN SYNTHESIS-RELATED 1-like isoform X1 [Actinidia eriantha]
MAMDMRQIVAALLTVSMFVMLGNMIKRDHFDSLESVVFDRSFLIWFLNFGKYKAIKVSKQGLVKVIGATKGVWKGDEDALKPCWNKPLPKEGGQSRGFIIFSLTDGPEYHVSQIADAVVVATYLGATLVLPHIRGTKPRDSRSFGEIYNEKKFVKSLDGIVRIAKYRPPQLSVEKLTAVRVPNRVSEAYIATNIEPLFKTKGNLSLETNFPSSTTMNAKEFEYFDSLSCLAMFGTLELQSELKQAVGLMVERLRALSRKSNGPFVAVDLRVEMLENKECRESGDFGKLWCYNAVEVGEFLKGIGFHRNTTIYLTQSGWHSLLDPLRQSYPKTYTKDDIRPAGKKAKLLNIEISEFAKFVDFHICSESDVFVPAKSGLFYTNVVGKRIASRKTQILVPSKTTSSSSSDAHISPYISKKSHSAFSCFC